MLLDLAVGERTSTPASRASSITRRSAAPVISAFACVKTVTRPHGSALRAAASRSSAPPARPGSASHTKVSRLPAGPGRPEERVAEHRQAELGARELAHRDQRRAPVVGRAHDAALPHALAAHLELRLDHRQQVEARRRGAATTAGSTLVSEMNDTSATIRSGA